MAKTKKEKKEKKAGKRMKKKELVKALLDFFHVKQDEVLSLKYIFEQLHLTTHPLKMLCMDILSELSDDDYITEVDKHKYKLNNHGVEMTGTFQRKSNGKNSFIPEGGGDPIFIAERNSAHAMAGDKVRIAFYAKRRGREAEGEVIEILERANDTFVGTLEVAKSYAFLVTENRTLANDIFIPKEKLKGGKTGDKAIVKVVEWLTRQRILSVRLSTFWGKPEITPPRCTPSWPNSDCRMFTPHPWKKPQTGYLPKFPQKNIPNVRISAM